MLRTSRRLTCRQPLPRLIRRVLARKYQQAATWEDTRLLATTAAESSSMRTKARPPTPFSINPRLFSSRRLRPRRQTTQVLGHQNWLLPRM